MDRERAILKFKDQERNDPERSLLSKSIEESLMKNPQENNVIESLEELIDFGEEQGQISHKDVFRFVPRAKDDQELLQEILDVLVSLDIQIVKNGNQLAWDDDIIPTDDKADQKIHFDVTHLKEELEREAVDVGDSVGLYLSQVSTVPLLDRNEEIELAKRIERGREASNELAKGDQSAKNQSILRHLIEDGHAAREHLLLANVRLVFSVAKKYMGRGIPLLDLVQEGHIGLMRATTKFDYRRGHKFSTYATWWIRQAVSRYVADQGRTIRLPVHMGDRINKMLRVRHKLIQELGHEPTSEELAQELNESLTNIEDMLIYAQQIVSLDLPVSDDEEATLADFIESEETPNPEEITTQQLLSEHVNELLAQLPPREALILRLRFGLSGGHPHTLNEIGNKLGITRERVRQIEAQARHRVRGYGIQNHLKEYLKD
jgi:RNA polymerase primary sigma factor